MRLYRGWAILLGIVLLSAGCAQRDLGEPSSLTSGALTTRAIDARAMDIYMIGPGDQLQIDVWRNPDVSATVPVRPDGRISLPLIGDVKAVDRTPEELARGIESDLQRYIRDPKVTVVVTELRSHEYMFRVRVTGAVENPLSIPHRPGMTVLDLVLEAGGTTDFASANNAKLYRSSEAKTRVYPVYLDDILLEGDLETNYVLEPGDIITVPERLF